MSRMFNPIFKGLGRMFMKTLVGSQKDRLE